MVSPQCEAADETELLDYSRRELAKFKVSERDTSSCCRKCLPCPSPNWAKISWNLLRKWALAWIRNDD